MKKTDSIMMYTAVIAFIGSLLLLSAALADVPVLATYGCGIILLYVVVFNFFLGRSIMPGGLFNSDRLFSVVILIFLALVGDVVRRMMFMEGYFDLAVISWSVSIGPAACLIGYLTLLFQKIRHKGLSVFCF